MNARKLEVESEKSEVCAKFVIVSSAPTIGLMPAAIAALWKRGAP